MPTSLTTFPFTSFVKTAPKSAVAAVAALASFAIIGAVNAASFAFNKTTDLVAWAINDRRDESWAPFFMATFILISLAYLLRMKLLQDQPVNLKDIKLSRAELEAMIKSYAQKQNSVSNPTEKAPKKSPAPETKPFLSDSDFAKNLKRAGSNLFAQTTLSPSPTSPSSHASTRPPTPATDSTEALLNDTYAEFQQSRKL